MSSARTAIPSSEAIPPVNRFRLPQSARAGIPALALTAVLLGACSSGGTPSVAPSGTGTPVQNLAAHTLNLKSSDFPNSWKTTSSNSGANPVRSSLNACVLQSQASAPATAAVSDNFLQSSSGQEVGSQVQVFDQSDQAVRTATVAATSAVSLCLGSSTRSAIAKVLPSQETVQGTVASAVRPPQPGPHAFGQRVVATIAYKGQNGQPTTTDVYVDVLGFARGTVVVEAEFENARSAPSASLESSTMKTLLNRAGAG